MTSINHPNPHDTTTAARDGYRGTSDRAPRLSGQLLLDAVIASYIHDISERHRNPQTADDRLAIAGTGGS